MHGQKNFDEYAAGPRALIVAAERLFGEFGLDGVSLRQITADAGQANTSAVHHHFGSKQGLIQAAYEMRLPVLEAARQARLDAMDRDGRCSVAALFDALLMPVIHIHTQSERLRHARFMTRLMPLSEQDHPYFHCLHLCQPSVEIGRRLQGLLPHLPPGVLNTRIRMSANLFLQGVWDEPRVHALKNAYRSREMYWNEILQMSLSALESPFPAPPHSDASVLLPTRATARRARPPAPPRQPMPA